VLFIAALFAAALSRPIAAHAQSDVIRGRIIGPDSVPIERATITVTSLNGNITRQARTDKAGRYQIVFPGDEGDYMVSVAALGFAARKFEIKRTGDQEILVADARLLKSAAQLDAVKVQAQRDKPIRDDNRPDIGGGERTVNGSALSADQLGDLAALAASLPGVQLIPGVDGGANGFSVLGLGADQNSMTLNGMAFGGGAIPRDANVSTSLSTSPYDVSKGNFSGGNLNIRTGRASNFIVRSGSANIDAPQAQWTDAAGRALHQQYANLSASGLFAGPIQSDKSFFNLSYQLGRRQSDLQSLLTTDPIGLQTAGLSPDSVKRLLNILGRAHIPQSGSGVPSDRYTDQALVLGSLDFTPPSSTTGQAFNLTYNASLNRSSAVSMSPTDLPSHSGDRTNWNAGIQGRHTNYFGFMLSETAIGVSQNKNYGSPYLDLPSGTVRVNSSFADGTPSVQTVGFGGNPNMNTSVTTTSAQFTNMLSWVSENNKHRIKFGSELRRDQYAQDLTTNRLGSFTFNSLADLDSGRPATFTRQLSPRKRSESEYIGALSLGDAYRPNSDVSVTYGLRLDGNRFTSEPTLNPDVERLFNISNDNVPNRFYLSPRVGFSWTYGAGPQVGAFDGAFRGPRATVRGGIGVFQSTPSAASIGNAMDNTGLPSAVQQLACVGVAAPSPDWLAYMTNSGAVPSTCANGTTGSVFSSTAPNVSLFDKNYVSPRSLRSNIQWNGPVLGNRFSTTVDVTYSLNVNQASSYDLNFKPEQHFALADEAGRPVFAQSGSIVPTTGSIATGEGRVTSAFSHVSELRSDMKSEARQVMVSLSPMAFNSTFNWGLSYVYANTREEYRGFTSTSGSPLDVAWGRSPFDSRHQIQYRFTWNAFDYIRIGWNGQFRSGTPYTPTVAGDINGDGYSNDRAFVFNPTAASTDPALASGMQSLLTNGSAGARDCLSRQLGKIADRNSCQGPWTTGANLTFSFNPIKVKMPQRATVSFQLSNPLSAADMLLHGENKQHGWGQSAFPSGQLLFVRGFDAATQRYKYEVNQRFGATAISQTIFRSPVILTTMLRFDVGPTRERQALTQMLDRGRSLSGNKIPEPALKAFGPIGITNPMATILRQADTLELTPQQADSIAVMNRGFTMKLDSIWTPIAKYLASLPDKYDQDEAYDRYRIARQTSVDALIKIAPTVRGLLTDDQMRKLPTFITPFLDRRYLASVRSGTAGMGLGMIMGGGMMGGPGGVSFGGGGGGGGQTVIRIGTP
jgi:hypothetical protein